MAWSGLQNEIYELKEPLWFAQPVLATNECAIPDSAQWWFRRKIYLKGSQCLWQYGVLSNISKYGIKFNCKLVTWSCAIKPLMALNMFHIVWKAISIKRPVNCWIKIDQLDVTCFIISLFNAQHVSDVSTSILRSLRFFCWVISLVVLLCKDRGFCISVR